MIHDLLDMRIEKDQQVIEINSVTKEEKEKLL